MAFVLCNNDEECGCLAVLLDGQRRFCEYHHQEAVQNNQSYREDIERYRADPELVAAVATFQEILREQGGANALIFMWPPLEVAVRELEAVKAAARERLQPGIHAAEEAADEDYRLEQQQQMEITWEEIRIRDAIRSDAKFRELEEDEEGISEYEDD